MDLVGDKQWLLVTLSLFSATTSVLLQPVGHSSFGETIKRNAFLFSPAQSILQTITIGFLFLCWRISNLAGTDLCLRLVIRTFYPFPSSFELSPSTQQSASMRFARRIVLLGGTLPLYIALLIWGINGWMKLVPTCLIVGTLISELAEHDSLGCKGVLVSKNWPHSVLLRRCNCSGPHCTPSRAAKPTDKTGPKKTNPQSDDGDRSLGITTKPQSSSPDPEPEPTNLCSRAESLLSWIQETNHAADHPLDPDNTPKIENMLMTTQPRWTCGHPRCLPYISLFIGSGLSMFACLWGELGVLLYLLHLNLRPVLVATTESLFSSKFFPVFLISWLFTAPSYIRIFILAILGHGVDSVFHAICRRTPIIRDIAQRLQGPSWSGVARSLRTLRTIVHLLIGVLSGAQALSYIGYCRVLRFTKHLVSYSLEGVIFWLLNTAVRAWRSPGAKSTGVLPVTEPEKAQGGPEPVKDGESQKAGPVHMSTDSAPPPPSARSEENTNKKERHWSESYGPSNYERLTVRLLIVLAAAAFVYFVKRPMDCLAQLERAIEEAKGMSNPHINVYGSKGFNFIGALKRCSVTVQDCKNQDGMV